MAILERTLREIPDGGRWTVHREDGSQVVIVMEPTLGPLLAFAGAVAALGIDRLKPGELPTEAQTRAVVDAACRHMAPQHADLFFGNPQATPPVRPLKPGVLLAIALDLLQIAGSALGTLLPSEALADPTSGRRESPASSGGASPTTSSPGTPRTPRASFAAKRRASSAAARRRSTA